MKHNSPPCTKITAGRGVVACDAGRKASSSNFCPSVSPYHTSRSAVMSCASQAAKPNAMRNSRRLRRLSIVNVLEVMRTRAASRMLHEFRRAVTPAYPVRRQIRKRGGNTRSSDARCRPANQRDRLAITTARKLFPLPGIRRRCSLNHRRKPISAVVFEADR